MQTTRFALILVLLGASHAALAPLAMGALGTTPTSRTPASSGAGATDNVKPAAMPYEKIAKDFALGLGLDPAKPEEIRYEDVLVKHFVPLRLGVFDMRFPAADLEKRGDDFRGCAGAVLEAQEKWLDWLQASGADVKPLRDDLKLLQGWVKGWKTAMFSTVKETGERDVFKMLQATEKIVDAAKRVADAMGKGLALGPAREQATSVRLILLPARKSFTEFIYFSGWIIPADRALYWIDSVPDWTQCFIATDQVIALEYAIGSRQPGDYTSGTRMNERDPTVMEQQVVQLAMTSLFQAYYGDRAPGAFLSGLSMNLVVDCYGTVNTRVDGDTRSKSTGKREVFVPGGNSEGGFLGKASAENRWREKHGADHFVAILRSSQKEGEELGKLSKNKVACFSMRSDSGGEKHLVTAPFLGSAAANTQAPPTAFQGEFAEFLRAYKSGFIFWLQTKSKGSDKPSREKFAALLKKLADPNMQGDFEQVFKDVYDGAPLSAADADKASLEGQFLIWLSKQK